MTKRVRIGVRSSKHVSTPTSCEVKRAAEVANLEKVIGRLIARQRRR